mmetsp:Transcript_95653/g.270750  ORF Transcript_95653/g.270750 Transcript_95653/m.270750 type:complete len:242 (+) Transcript_95653:81-806(+)
MTTGTASRSAVVADRRFPVALLMKASPDKNMLISCGAVKPRQRPRRGFRRADRRTSKSLRVPGGPRWTGTRPSPRPPPAAAPPPWAAPGRRGTTCSWSCSRSSSRASRAPWTCSCRTSLARCGAGSPGASRPAAGTWRQSGGGSLRSARGSRSRCSAASAPARNSRGRSPLTGPTRASRPGRPCPPRPGRPPRPREPRPRRRSGSWSSPASGRSSPGRTTGRSSGTSCRPRSAPSRRRTSP